MVRTQIQLTQRQAELIRQVAAQRKVSMAQAIRLGLDQFLAANAGVDREERVRRALAVAGRFRSGKRDTASRHDAVLAEAFRP